MFSESSFESALVVFVSTNYSIFVDLMFRQEVGVYVFYIKVKLWPCKPLYVKYRLVTPQMVLHSPLGKVGTIVFICVQLFILKA